MKKHKKKNSDGDFLDFLISPWDMFCTDLPVFTVRSMLCLMVFQGMPSPTFEEGVQTLFLWQETIS